MVAPAAPPVFRPFGRQTWRDPFTLYRQLRQVDPVHRSADGYWVLTRFSDVWRAAADTGTFSSAEGLTFGNDVEALGLLPTIVMMDPPEHTRYRRLVNQGFTPRRVAELEPELRSFVRQQVADLAEAGSGDFISAVARPVPGWVVAHYLGVPPEDRHRFDEWTEGIVQGGGSGYGSLDAVQDLYAYFTDLIERRRHEPGDDLVSMLVRADEEGRGIGAEGILGYGFVMIAGGNDTATGLLGGAAELLTAWPGQRERLLEDPALLPGAVEELLRLTSPVQGLCRVATRDVEVDGRLVRRGDRVLLSYGAANRDPEEFGPDAEQLDVTRPIRRLLTFSTGNHFCLGAAVARLQGRIVLDELLRQCPDFAVDAEAGVFADGAFTRRYERLPFVAQAR